MYAPRVLERLKASRLEYSGVSEVLGKGSKTILTSVVELVVRKFGFTMKRLCESRGVLVKYSSGRKMYPLYPFTKS